jgi:uncharacterized protein
VKVFVAEEGRGEVLALLEDETCATSGLSYVECRAAFARRMREAALDRRGHDRCVEELDERWPNLAVVDMDRRLIGSAGALATVSSLRAGDAIHLASARTIGGRSTEVPFACWDRRLWDAATASGFRMVPAGRP